MSENLKPDSQEGGSQKTRYQKDEDWYSGPNAYDLIQGYVVQAAEEYGISPDLLNSVIHAESSFRANAKSGAGGLGYTQITEDVAEQYGVTDPLDPIQNIRAGAHYLSDLVERFDGDQAKAIQAYHQGPTAVSEGRMPGPKTRKYVQSVSHGTKNPDTVRENYVRPRESWKRRSLHDYLMLSKN